MKVGMSSTNDNLDGQLDPHFGRCPFLLIVNTDNMSIEAIDNQANSIGGGAGFQAAKQIVSKGVRAVITGKCGPKAVQLFSDAGVDVYLGQKGKLKSVLDAYQKGNLTASAEAKQVLHPGTGGRGHCKGQGNCRKHNHQTVKGSNHESCRADAR